ncbi:MAG: AGE family epimerase/isomerase [Bacteroidota bacterium]
MYLKEVAKKEIYLILDWWIEHMIDEANGGFYGRIDGFNQLHPKADKGIILNTRLLWSFASAARILDEPKYQQIADRAYYFLIDNFSDDVNGGMNWMLNYQGQVIDGKKQIYAQAFAIYAFSEYHRLSGQPKALEKAIALFKLIEQHSFDQEQGGYLEAFGQAWEPLEDFRLSEKDANEAKTMNTHLHILEAYTNLYRVYNNTRLASALGRLIQLFLDRFIDSNTHHLHLFFDEDWKLKSDEVSYGHDIEAAWLLVEAAEVLGNPPLLSKCKEIAVQIAEVTIAEGLDNDGSLFNEGRGKAIIDSDKHWWPQAEAIVGFYNAYQISGKTDYIDRVQQIWQFVERYLKDPEGGEWHWMVNHKGIPILDKEDKAGPWKAPYHNGRMCMELLHRIQ